MDRYNHSYELGAGLCVEAISSIADSKKDLHSGAVLDGLLTKTIECCANCAPDIKELAKLIGQSACGGMMMSEKMDAFEIIAVLEDLTDYFAEVMSEMEAHIESKGKEES